MDIWAFSDEAETARAAAREMAAPKRQTVSACGRMAMAVSGGMTP